MERISHPTISRRNFILTGLATGYYVYRILRTPNPTTQPANSRNTGKASDLEPVSNEPSAPSETISQQVFENYLNTCELCASTHNSSVSFYRRDIADGEAYIAIAQLAKGAMLYPLTANDATPMQEEHGRRRWENGQNHLEAPFSIADRHHIHPKYGNLVAAITGDFFSEGIATYPEGPLVIADRGILLPQPERSGLALTYARRIPYIGRYYYEDLVDAQKQYLFEVIVGGGIPTILPGRDGEIKVANPSVACEAETPEYTCFNAFGENFGNTINYRIQNYTQDLRWQGMIGYANIQNLGNILYFVASHNTPQINVAIDMLPITHRMLLVDGGSQTSFQWRLNDTQQPHPLSFQQDPIPILYALYAP